MNTEVTDIQNIKDQFVKTNRGRKIVYLIPVTETEDDKIFLDFTDLAKPANNKDRRSDHTAESGPNFGIELMKAIKYADYLKDCNIHERNQYQYGTKKGYSIEIHKKKKSDVS